MNAKEALTRFKTWAKALGIKASGKIAHAGNPLWSVPADPDEDLICVWGNMSLAAVKTSRGGARLLVRDVDISESNFGAVLEEIRAVVPVRKPTKYPLQTLPSTLSLGGLRGHLNTARGFANSLERFGEDPILMRDAQSRLADVDTLIANEVHRRAASR